MPNYLEIAVADIEKKPPRKQHPNDTQLTIGDLHGNALKLLYILIRHGFFDLSNELYALFVHIYKKPADCLTRQDIDDFNVIIDSLEVLERRKLLRLIGDETADRGQNDYFTLKLIKKIVIEQIQLVILISNHGYDFIRSYERYIAMGNVFPSDLKHGFSNSLNNLRTLIYKGIISNEEFLDLANEYYRPNLKLIDYSIDPLNNAITIFSHAIIGLDLIKSFCNFLGIAYKDNLIPDLAGTIDNLHSAFKERVNINGIHTLNRSWVTTDSTLDLLRNNPLTYLMFNRDFRSTPDHLMRPSFLDDNGAKIYFTHGHDPDAPSENHVFNLDQHNILGKSIAPCGEYSYLRSDDPVSYQLLKEDSPASQSTINPLILYGAGLMTSGLCLKMWSSLLTERAQTLTVRALAGTITGMVGGLVLHSFFNKKKPSECDLTTYSQNDSICSTKQS